MVFPVDVRMPAAREEKIKIGSLLLLAGIPALVGDATLRVAAAVLCYGTALFFALAALKRYRESLEREYIKERLRHVDALNVVITPLISHLNSSLLITPALVSQLKEVIRHTEEATSGMVGKFMAIAGRARKQGENAAQAVMGFGITDDRNTIEATSRLEELKTENEALARDINSIIMSMQFQDITQQRIERVIEALGKIQQESGELLGRLRSMNERIGR